MIEIGSKVEYNGKEHIVIKRREYRAGQYVYSLRLLDGTHPVSAFESSLRVLEGPTADSIKIIGMTATSAAGMTEGAGKTASNASPTANATSCAPKIEKRSGYLYVDFSNKWSEGSRIWKDFYNTSLLEQYDVLKRRLGRYAPDTLGKFAQECFLGVTATYYLSMPGFDRKMQTRERKDGKTTNPYINNVVIRPDLSNENRRSKMGIPSQYDVIFIGDITFGSVVSFSVKGIELIDSKVAKYGELGISCVAACAVSQKMMSFGSVPDYGNVSLKDPVLTNDFIDRLCKEVYPIPDPSVAYSKFEKWKEYLNFRRYYLGIQSQRCEEIIEAFPVRGFIVSKKKYDYNKDSWSELLYNGHKEFITNDSVFLSREVSGSEEQPLICVAIEKNRKKVLSETTGKNGTGGSKYEITLRRYTWESLGLSPMKPAYDKEGKLVRNSGFYQYLLGERFAFTHTDIEPDYSEIEKVFTSERSKAFTEIDNKYVAVISNELERFEKAESERLNAVYDGRLNDYADGLAKTLARDILENNDEAVEEEYANAVIRPIEREYGRQIEALEKRKANIKSTKHSDKHSKKSDKHADEDADKRSAKRAEEIAEIDAEVDRLKEAMRSDIVMVSAATPIAVYYKARNAKRVEAQKKSLAIKKHDELEKAKADRRKQLEASYKSESDEEKKIAEKELRRKADDKIAVKREKETIRRYEIYFRPEDSSKTYKDLEKELNEINRYRYLTYDSRAERAKLERQEKALDSILEGYVKNPYLAAYLFAPGNLAEANRPVLEDPEWCTENPLNDTQKIAVKRALASESIFLLQGPPGTGKTQVIAEITAQLTKQGKKVLISSETHKAIDNVFERLPKIPEIRPIRLIPSQNNRETKYSPEKLVDNFYLNISENLRRQIEQFENFNEMRDKFSEEMTKLRADHDRILRLQRENAGIETERKRLIEQINKNKLKIEDLRNERDEIDDEIEAFTRTMKYVESYRFISEGAKPLFINRYCQEVEQLLSEFSCFVDRGPEDVQAIVSADISRIQGEIASICNDDRLVKLEAERKRLQSEIGELSENDDAFVPGTEAEKALKAKRRELLDIKSQIDKLKGAGDASVSTEELSKIVSESVIANKSLVALVPDQIKNFKVKLNVIVSDILDAIDREISVYYDSRTALIEKISDVESEINRANARYEKLGENESVAELAEMSARIKRKIGNFFRDFSIIQEYSSIAEALEIINDEWQKLNVDHERTREANRQKIPMFKDICEYLSSPDILDEDRRNYTQKLYENANVFGLTCTSRDKFDNSQLKDSIEIRTLGIDVVIIDEVSKSSFLDLLIPILYGKTVILVGDHRQLPPMYDLARLREEDIKDLDENYITMEKNAAYTKLYEECFFKTLYESVPENFKVMLNKQYRCHSHIMEVFNHFYGGSETGLVVGKKQQDDEKQHNLLVRINGNVVIDPDHHIYFVDCNEKESNVAGSRSIMNQQEANVVMALLGELNKSAMQLVKRDGLKINVKDDERPSVGVICTYGDQVGLIKRRKKGRFCDGYNGFSGKDDERLVVSTVDDFQGDERDIIIVSMVRNPRSERYDPSFVNKFERINVALSRARKLLIIVGSKDFLIKQKLPILPDLSGNKVLDKHNFPVYQEIINTIDYRGRILTANDILGGDNEGEPN